MTAGMFDYLNADQRLVLAVRCKGCRSQDASQVGVHARTGVCVCVYRYIYICTHKYTYVMILWIDLGVLRNA